MSAKPNGSKARVSRQNICDPIVLRETSRIRLTFYPTLVNDPSQPNASVEGSFIYQRRSAGETPMPMYDSVVSLKAGDVAQLSLTHGELLALLLALVPLYNMYRSARVPHSNGPSTNRIELPPDMLTTREDRDDASWDLLHRLSHWLQTAEGKEAAERLTAGEPNEIPEITAALGVASLKSAYSYWTDNRSNSSESFWQETFRTRSYVLSQLFAYPVVVFGEKAYVGGKQITARGGKYPDFLLSTSSTAALVVIEIKTPQTSLLGAEYRSGVFPLSAELHGAVAQTLRYRQMLMKHFNSVTDETEERPTLGEPRGIIIAGNSDELDVPAKRECFELQRERMAGITVITYDELFDKLNDLIALLERPAELSASC